MNTLGARIAVEKNARGEWIFKGKNIKGERASLVKYFLISIVVQGEITVISRRNQERRVKYKLNKSWEKRMKWKTRD